MHHKGVSFEPPGNELPVHGGTALRLSARLGPGLGHPRLAAVQQLRARRHRLQGLP